MTIITDEMRRAALAEITHPVAALKSLTQKPTWPDYWRQTTAFETDTGRSALAARTALHAPKETSMLAMTTRMWDRLAQFSCNTADSGSVWESNCMKLPAEDAPPSISSNATWTMGSPPHRIRVI